MKPLSPDEKNNESFSSLLERFMQEFNLKLCTTLKDKEKVYHLRYNIYCEELQYEEPTDPIKKLEYDIYDQNSFHCLIEHRRTGIIAGCVRVVIPDHEGPNPLNKLPLQSYGGESLTHPELHPDHLLKDSYYEISRLAVNRLFRSKAKDEMIILHMGNSINFTNEERKLFPILSSSLFITGYALGRQLGKTQVFAMMEPSLPRLLSLTGFHFTKVGETIDFHGRRSAYYIDKDKAESGLRKNLMPLYLHIQKTLSPQLDKVIAQEASTLVD